VASSTNRHDGALEREFLSAPDPEAMWRKHVDDVFAQTEPAPGAAKSATGFRPFRPLLMGYTGAGNIGADVRVHETFRQLSVALAHTGFRPGVMVLEPPKDRALAGLQYVPVDGYFPRFLTREVSSFDGVIVCEGSMFTSKFCNMLTGAFAAGVGYSAHLGKVGIGYGSDGDVMEPAMKDFAARMCGDALIFCRSVACEKLVGELGIRARPGADPGWTFEPSGVDAKAILTTLGWDGRSKVVAVCPVNPFWWPVRVDAEKAQALKADGRFADLHVSNVLFHSWSDESATKLRAYVDALRETIETLRARGCFPVVVGMERLDRRVCATLRSALDSPVPELISGDYGMNDIVGVIREASLVVSSRFHATVFALAAAVPVVGVTMDARIRSMFEEHGLGDDCLDCDAPDLGEVLPAKAATMLHDPRELPRTYNRICALNIKACGDMAVALVDELSAHYPDFPRSPLQHSWDAHLPPLSPRLERILSDVL
jgi:polysaccharide pyruvyl transferase WcaK-like protein